MRMCLRQYLHLRGRSGSLPVAAQIESGEDRHGVREQTWANAYASSSAKISSTRVTFIACPGSHRYENTFATACSKQLVELQEQCSVTCPRTSV